MSVGQLSSSSHNPHKMDHWTGGCAGITCETKPYVACCGNPGIVREISAKCNRDAWSLT